MLSSLPRRTLAGPRRLRLALRPIGRAILTGPALGALTFLVYLRTLAPGVFGFDSAELSTGAHTLGIVHPPGYPLYLLLAKSFTLLPLRDVAFRLNLMSAVFASLTVVLVFRLLWRWTGRRDAAWAAAGWFSASIHFWQMALVAEVYTLHTFFLALNLLLLSEWHASGDRRALLAFAFAYGLSLSNHTSGILFAPGYGWLVLSGVRSVRRDWRVLAAAPALFVLGLAPYLYLPLRAAADPPLNYVGTYYGKDLTTLAGVWWMVSGQAYRFFAFGYDWPQVPAEFTKFLGSFWRDYLGVGVLMGIGGWAPSWRRAPRQVVGWSLIFAANVVFFANYRVMDKDTMFLPAYLVWTPFVAAGLKALGRPVRRAVDRQAWQEWWKPVRAGLLVGLVPLAIALNWRWVDMSRMDGPRLFAQQVLETAAPNSLVMADWSSAVVLEYFQLVERQRPDLEIYNRSRVGVARFYGMWRTGLPPGVILERIDEEELAVVNREITRRPVYVVEYDPLFAGEYEYLPEGNYFKLIRRGRAGASWLSLGSSP